MTLVDGPYAFQSLILIHHHRRPVPALRHRQGHNVAGDRVAAADGTLVAAHRVGVRVGPTDPVILGTLFPAQPHQHARLGVSEAVPLDAVDQSLLAKAQPPRSARERQQEWCPRHGFHPPSHHNISLAGSDRICPQHDGLHPRGTDLVHRTGGDGRGQARQTSSAVGRCLSKAGRQHVSHDDLFDQLNLAVQTRPLDGT